MQKKTNTKDRDKKPKKVWNIQEEQNWDEYNEELLKNIDKIDKTTVDTFSDSLIGIINASMEKHIGKIKIGKRMIRQLPQGLMNLLKQKRDYLRRIKALLISPEADENELKDLETRYNDVRRCIDLEFMEFNRKQRK